MENTVKNRFKLFWHCLSNFHRSFHYSPVGKVVAYYACFDCDYGECEYTEEGKEIAHELGIEWRKGYGE